MHREYAIQASPAGSVKKVALCGGSGASLLNEAVSAKADAFVTGDIKYHTWFEADNRILLVGLRTF